MLSGEQIKHTNSNSRHARINSKEANDVEVDECNSSWTLNQELALIHFYLEYDSIPAVLTALRSRFGDNRKWCSAHALYSKLESLMRAVFRLLRLHCVKGEISSPNNGTFKQLAFGQNKYSSMRKVFFKFYLEYRDQSIGISHETKEQARRALFEFERIYEESGQNLRKPIKRKIQSRLSETEIALTLGSEPSLFLISKGSSDGGINFDEDDEFLYCESLKKDELDLRYCRNNLSLETYEGIEMEDFTKMKRNLEKISANQQENTEELKICKEKKQIEEQGEEQQKLRQNNTIELDIK